jgi:hypothetical protein
MPSTTGVYGFLGAMSLLHLHASYPLYKHCSLEATIFVLRWLFYAGLHVHQMNAKETVEARVAAINQMLLSQGKLAPNVSRCGVMSRFLFLYFPVSISLLGIERSLYVHRLALLHLILGSVHPDVGNDHPGQGRVHQGD